MKLINELLKINSEDIAAVRKMYGKSNEDVKCDVNILKEWMAKQPHLPQNYDEERLERMLLRNKFRIEQCKSKIDCYFTLRGLYPQFYENHNPTLESFQNIRKYLVYVPIPELTTEKERVIFVRYIPGTDHLFSIHAQMEYVFAMLDLEFSYDYAVATIFVVDCSALTMNHVTTLELNLAMQILSLYQEGYSSRISSIHWFKGPKYINIIYKIMKLVMKPKLFNKINIHNDLPALLEVFDKKYLPSDYGGDQKSVQELHDLMGKMWEEEIDFIIQNAKLVSNEKLRIGKPYCNELFGTDGTFKQIYID